MSSTGSGMDETGDPTPLVTIFEWPPNPLGAAGSNKFDAFDGKPGVTPDGDYVAFAATVRERKAFIERT